MPSDLFEQLRKFVTQDMRMSHVYQPVMLRVLLQNGGQASIEAIAKAFVAQDRSQIEYYSEIVKQMPGRVLRSHDIVVRDGQTYRLAGNPDDLTEDEISQLIDECNAKLEQYLEKRGLSPWQHRRKGTKPLSGSLRYDIIKRAKGRCEACGISVEERALEVDHIIPRNKGGTDDRWNLQALCYVCNAQKRDRDDTDFKAVLASYDDRADGCPFCDVHDRAIVAENRLAIVFEDKYPVTDGHMLIVPRRHVGDYFDLHQPEVGAVQQLLEETRDRLRSADHTIDGFNVGINAGATAGQTVDHAHVHLIAWLSCSPSRYSTTPPPVARP
jgi:diadenosine tetraphosphate (Ap4A) HIT family hydrolase